VSRRKATITAKAINLGITFPNSSIKIGMPSFVLVVIENITSFVLELNILLPMNPTEVNNDVMDDVFVIE
jgi:hypothetical protein